MNDQPSDGLGIAQSGKLPGFAGRGVAEFVTRLSLALLASLASTILAETARNARIAAIEVEWRRLHG